ncbi:stage II sporulation protein M [Methanobrevibacter sp.]|uniref:stage II sporulation protein M n=1 Tax=Methanobrevibacter sp. TaxID=66852 RepID=UPI003869EBC6
MNILIKFKNLVIESLKDNKKLIIGLAIIFIVSFIGGWALSGSAMKSVVANLSASNATGDMTSLTATELFVDNEFGGIVTYFGSVFFAIFAIVSLVYNGLNLGMFGQMFDNLIPNGGLKYIVYIIPHGIFELTATVLQSAAGVLLFLFIWRFIKACISSEVEGVSNAFEISKKALIQSIVLMIFSTILLLIAAPIEAYFSVPFSEFVLGF